MKLNPDEIEFLEQSNFIESVRDSLSLEDAVEAWEYLKEQDTLSVSVVLHTHKLLMKNQGLEKNEIGIFRKVHVRVGSRVCIHWREVPSRMWAWTLNAMRKYPPVDDKLLHIQYEIIHPFIDGNGRTGRMFMNWLRIKRLKLPILIIKEEDKREYYSWFKGGEEILW